MLCEFGFDPEVKGLELTNTLIEEDQAFNPNCPCPTRTCPQHGFCKYCIQHHKELSEKLLKMFGAPPPEPEKHPGEYNIDHSKPYCMRVPNEERALKMEDYEV